MTAPLTAESVKGLKKGTFLVRRLSNGTIREVGFFEEYLPDQKAIVLDQTRPYEGYHVKGVDYGIYTEAGAWKDRQLELLTQLQETNTHLPEGERVEVVPSGTTYLFLEAFGTLKIFQVGGEDLMSRLSALLERLEVEGG
jgi:hypothetical protein